LAQVCRFGVNEALYR